MAGTLAGVAVGEALGLGPEDPGADLMAFAFGHVGGDFGDWLTGPDALPAPNLQDHHIFPRQFEDYFDARGINIDDYTVTLGQTQHLQGVHGSGLGTMPGGWNSQWRNFIANNPNASASEVYQQAGKMMDQYGLSGLPIHPYGQ
jgi:Predicted lipoprotein of unknown function (DUF2380)